MQPFTIYTPEQDHVYDIVFLLVSNDEDYWTTKQRLQQIMVLVKVS